MYSRSNGKHNKRGFTLIEMMLAIGIMMIMISAVFATFSMVNTAHAKVALINDAKDYASLNMQAITYLVEGADKVRLSSETAFLSVTDNDYTDGIYFDAAGVLYHDTRTSHSAAFTYSQYTVSNGAKNKWTIVPTFTVDSLMVRVKLDVMDNSKSPAVVFYTLTKSIYLPNMSTGSNIKGTTGTVLKYHDPVFS